MKKEIAIEIIGLAQESFDHCIKQSSFLVDGVDLHKAKVPVNATEWEFGEWLYFNKKALSNFSWYKNLKKSFDKFHLVYCELYYGAVRKYNPKTKEQLERCYMRLMIQSRMLFINLDCAKNHLLQLSGSDFEKQYNIPEVKITAKQLIEKRRSKLIKMNEHINFSTLNSKNSKAESREIRNQRSLRQQITSDKNIINISLYKLDAKYKKLAAG